MFKFMKTIKKQISSKTDARPKVKKTVSAPPVMNNIPKLPVVNGTLPYDVTPVMTPNHGGDDSAINELLEGRMDLDVILPDGKKERVTVERSTQMIDLLVKVTTPYKIKPGGHMIQVFDERGRDLLYKPSTYIGFLDTNTIFVVPKKKPADNKKLTFEQTSRLQIRLPHNQRIAYRFSPKITLHEIKQTVCREKNLDTTLYHLAHPNQMDVVMDGNMTFENYNFKEICLISSKSMDVNSSQLESIKYPSHNELEQKEKALSFQNNHSTVVPSVDSLSSTVLDNKKSLSTTVRSKFKKGPAPPPPPPPQKGSKWETPSSNTTTSKVDRYELDKITHSRHSSDSSGYHEPSLLSEPPTVITTNQVEDFSNHKTISDKKTSTPKENSNIETEERSSLSKPISPSLSVGKKRKAPPPPVQSSCTKANGYVRNLNISQPLSTLTSDSSDQLEFTHPENCMLSENKESSDKHETNLKNTVAIPIDSQDNDKYCRVNTSFFNRNADEISSFTSNITLHHSNIKSSDLDHSHTLLDYHNSELTRRDLDSCCSVSDTEKGEFIREESDLNSVSDIDEDKVTRGDFDAHSVSDIDEDEMTRGDFNSHSVSNIYEGDTSKSSRFVGLLSSLNTISDLDQTFQQTTAKEEQIMAKEHQTGRSKGSCIIKGSDKEADSAHLEPYSRNISDCSQVKRRVKTDIQQPGEILIDQKMKPPALLKEKVSWKATGQNNHCTVNENNTSFKESIKSLSNDNNSQSTLPPTPSSPPPLKAVSDDISVMRNHSERNSENTNGKLIKPNDLSVVAAVRNLRLKNFTIKPYTREEEEDSFSSEAQDFKSTQKYLELNDNPIRNYLEKPFLRAPNKENLQGTDSRENKFKVHKSESFHCQDINSENETKPKLLGCERTGSSQEETNPIIMNPQNNKVVYSGGGSVRGIKGKVRIRCLAIDDQNISSLFNGNTTSMTDLSQQALMEADEQHDDDQQTDFSERLGRVKSEVDGSQYSNVARSEGSIVKVSSDQQNELQDEYQKLQNQLLLYQKKLLDNQELLEKENIMSKFSLSPLTRTKVFFEEQQLLSSDTEELKSEILPKLKPSSVRAAKKDHSSTVDLQSRIHSETLTSAKTKHSDSFNKPTKKNLIHSHLLDEFQPTTDPGKKVVSHENEQETIQNRKQSKELISNKFPWLSLENQLENEDISFKQIYKQLKDNSYKPSNRANQQTTVTKNVAYRTNSLNLEKNSNYFKQDEWLLKQPKSPDTEELNATQSFKNIFAPQPYKSKPISHTFRLPPTKILGAPIVRGFSEEVKSKILESVKFSSVKDTVASNSKEDIPMHEEIAVSPLQQKHAFQLHKTGVGNKFSKSVADEGNVGAPVLPRTLPSETNEVSSTSNTQVNSFPSRNFDKEPSGSKKLQNANVNSRDQLMMEIKTFGGQNSLKKVPPRQPSWQLRVFGSSSTS